jgi:hypothetical protein
VDILLLVLIVLAVVSIGGWGYGTYYRPVGPVGGPVVEGPGWVSPLGILGVILIIGILAMLFTGWRPLGPVW